MLKKEILNYFEAQYPNWLRYAAKHCQQVCMIDEPADLLHEVLEQLLTTNRVLVEKLYDHQEEGERGLHKYVLKMIALSLHSPQSPYQRKIKAQRLELTENKKVKMDDVNYLAGHYDELKERMRQAQFSEEDRQLLLWRLGGESLQSYPSDEPRTRIYRRFQKLLDKVS
ncbi:MAG: hypothetical protein ACK5LR_08935 [Mangrovibacterium sp.]